MSQKNQLIQAATVRDVTDETESTPPHCAEKNQPLITHNMVERAPMMPGSGLKGPRCEIEFGHEHYPTLLMDVDDPPECLYCIGNIELLEMPCLAIIGARKSTPYGRAAARRFAGLASDHDIVIVSGGAIGCDSAAHQGALDKRGKTIVVLGGGCDQLYPARNKGMFQQVIDAGGLILSEQWWDFPARPYTFRARNRIIAGLAKATLIVEAGMPSGTFSTADEALAANRDVWVVPGPITSPTSLGANHLIYSGAVPIITTEVFESALSQVYGCLCIEDLRGGLIIPEDDELLASLCAEPKTIEELLHVAFEVPPDKDKLSWVLLRLAQLEGKGLIARFPDGRYGPAQV